MISTEQYKTNAERKEKTHQGTKNNIHFKSTTKNPFMHNIIHLYYMRFVQHHTNKQKTPSSLHPVHDDVADHDTLMKQVKARTLRPPLSLRSVFGAKT